MTATFDGPAYRPGDEAFEAEIETDNRSPTRMRTAAPILLDTVRAMPYADIATVHNDPTGPYQCSSPAGSTPEPGVGPRGLRTRDVRGTAPPEAACRPGQHVPGRPPPAPRRVPTSHPPT